MSYMILVNDGRGCFVDPHWENNEFTTRPEAEFEIKQIVISTNAAVSRGEFSHTYEEADFKIIPKD